MTDLSICIPSVRSDQIDDAVESVLVDLDRHDLSWEIIVGVCGFESFDLDDRCRVVQIPEGWNAVENRHQLHQMSEGEIVGVLDDDDRWIEGRIERTIPHLREEYEMIGSSVHDVIPSIEERAQPFERMCLVHSSMMFKNRWNYRKKFLFSQDYDLLLRMITDDRKIGFVDGLVERDLTDSLETKDDDRQDLFGRIAELFGYERILYGSDSYDRWSIGSHPSVREVNRSLEDLFQRPPLPTKTTNEIVDLT